MQTYRIEKIVGQNGKLTIQGLPFRNGEKVEIIILSLSQKPLKEKGYRLRDKPVKYVKPFDPIALEDWESA